MSTGCRLSTLNLRALRLYLKNMGGGGGSTLKKVNTHPKIPEIDLDFLIDFLIDFLSYY